MNITIDDFLRLRKTFPIVDVRSPKEFAQGHIRGAANIPILNDEERKAVGIDYKHRGQQEAIKTGYRMVTPRFPGIVEASRQVGNELLVHCWRGGMRSNNYCKLVEEHAIHTHALAGGYKSYRREAMECLALPLPLYVIGGCTGSGKTDVLQALGAAGEQIIDLEALASHRGSAFGGLGMPEQPSTEQFHNDLFEVLHSLDRARRIWIEDESLSIGKICLPEEFWRTLSQSPLIELQLDRSARVRRLAEEYGDADADAFLEAMGKIVKRLGGQHYKLAVEQYKAGDLMTTIDTLLNYYDKAYLQGLENNRDRIVHTLSWDGIDPGTVADDLASQFPAVSEKWTMTSG